MRSVKNEGFNFENKNALVTGASKGLGEQIALKLLERGVHVIGASRTGPPESFKSYIEQGQADYELGDLASEGNRIIRDVYEKHQGFEIFVNNAGAISADYFMATPRSKIRTDIILDLVVPLELHHDWLELYDEQYPKVRKPELSVNIGSVSSIYSWAGGISYQASKSGLKGAISGFRSGERYLLEQESDEVKQQIGPSAELTTRYLLIYPDNIDTGLLSRAQQESKYKIRGDALPPEIVVRTIMQAIEGRGKFGKYDDVAILVNPNDPGSRRKLPGVYLAFLPTDEETQGPDFNNRVLEKIADEDVLVRRA